MAMRRATVGMVLALSIMGLVMSTLGALVVTRTISNTGNVRVPPSVELGVYSDSGCTTPLSSVSWGTLNPGDTSTATMYLRNEGNVPITLSAQAADWNPESASSYLTFSWNCDSYVLAPNQVVQALLGLQVSSSINGITGFSFDITVTASQ